ncbi:MAG: hypothetical protein JWN04_359 [Myxococcaceae bacterium]|nr:hypothetical protein [Myxococcaceae bacterium]
MDDALEQAYAAGDHRRARTIARRIVQEASGAAVEPGLDAERVARARDILVYTEPDFFLAWVGALGLGLVAWLVYNYLL